MSYEMMHETRSIPLDNRPPHKIPSIGIGEPRGHWEGNTLVVETKNFIGAKLSVSGSNIAISYLLSGSRISRPTC
jgi:hypothetical protein